MGTKPPYRAFQPLQNLPLRLKGLLVVAFPLLGLIAVTVGFYRVQRENEAAEGQVAHTQEVRTQVAMAQAQLEEAETGMLGFALTLDPARLVPFRTALRLLPEILNRLESMMPNEPAQRERAKRVRAMLAQRLTYVESLTIQLQAGGPRPDLAVVERNISVDPLEVELEDMAAEEDRLLREHRSLAVAAWRRGYSVVIAGVLFVPIAATVAMMLFTAGITRRIESLEANARRLAQGEPISPMPSGRDEMGRLERSIEEAASLLAYREQQLRRAADELGGRVMERTAELVAEIGERKRTEDHLAETNERLRAVIDASPLAIIGLDLDGKVTSWNRGAESMFGWSAEEVIGEPLPIIPEGGEPRQRRTTPLSIESRRQRRDGKMLDVRVWTAPLRSRSGEIRGRIAIMADTTEQRRLEQQLTQAQKMEAVGRLAGGVAHDFKNVITVVAGYGHLLREAIKYDDELRESADEVLRAAERAAALASQLLAFSRRQVIQPRVVEMNKLVRNVERLLRRVIGEDVELKVVLGKEAGAVLADPGQVDQVLMNLAVNARDAMPGGGTLTIETSRVSVEEGDGRAHEGVQPGTYVALAVTDTGMGMDAETRSHLFEPFFTTKKPGMGTGLGLSIVYGIVKQHGGDISVVSEPGKGSTFNIYLPQTESVAAAEAPEEDATPAPDGHETVLVVEDEGPVRKLILGILKNLGYRVLEADSGEGAMGVLQQQPAGIDLLVTDVVLPKMSGHDLAQALASVRPELKVLFLSGYAAEGDRKSDVLDTGTAFLEKPFTPVALARKVRQVLDRVERV